MFFLFSGCPGASMRAVTVDLGVRGVGDDQDVEYDPQQRWGAAAPLGLNEVRPLQDANKRARQGCET